MAIKTNKSYTKRVKVTKNGRILARKPGQNHFNAKENAQKKSAKKSNIQFNMSNKDRSLFLANVKVK